MRNVLIKGLDEETYWKWKDVKNQLRAENWEEMVEKLIKIYKKVEEND